MLDRHGSRRPHQTRPAAAKRHRTTSCLYLIKSLNEQQTPSLFTALSLCAWCCICSIISCMCSIRCSIISRRCSGSIPAPPKRGPYHRPGWAGYPCPAIIRRPWRCPIMPGPAPPASTAYAAAWTPCVARGYAGARRRTWRCISCIISASENMFLMHLLHLLRFIIPPDSSCLHGHLSVALGKTSKG